MTKLQKTTRSLRGYRFTDGLMFILPVMVPFWYSRGLNQAQIGWLQTGFTVTMLSLQLPTGRLADHFGRRKLILIGAFMIVAGFLGYALAKNFWSMLVAEVILGIGMSCQSGADLALLRSELEADDVVDQEKHQVGILNSFGAGGELVSAIIGGWLASYALNLPLWATIGGVSLAIPFIWSLPKDEHHKQRQANHVPLKTVLKDFVGNARLRAIVSFAVVAGTMTHLFVWLMQPYLIKGGLAIGWFGLVWAAYSGVYMLLSWRAGKIEKKLGERWSVITALTVSVIAYLGLAGSMSLWALPLIGLFTLTRALTGPLTTHLIHENTDPEHYATVLSVVAAITGLVYAVLGPLSGWIVDTYGLRTNLVAIGCLGLVASLISFQLISRHHLTNPPS